MIRIAHISDIHLNKLSIKDAEQFIFKALVNDLEKLSTNKEIDLICLSGDLIDKAGGSFNNDIELALMSFEERVIDLIVKKLKFPKHRIFFTPGNHDILRSEDSDTIECGLSQILTCTEKVNQFIDSSKTEGINRILPFKKFEKNYYDGFKGNHKITNFYSSFELNIDGIKVGITCLNSAWRCYDSKTDKNRIILGERQVTEARDIIGGCDLKIAIIHHPLDWLCEFDYRDVKSLIQRDYHILLCGHVHEGSVWTKSEIHGNLFVSVAPSNWTYNIRSSDRIIANGYSVIDYDIIAQKITNLSRRYSHPKECFDPNTDLGDDKGVSVFPILTTTEFSKLKEKMDLARNIEVLHLNEINEHLLSYNTDTKAPKNIDEIFVMPRIVEKIQYDLEKKEEEKEYSIEDICKETGDMIIFGTKESGKTVLLDKLLIELTKNIQKYQEIPIKFDFNEVENKKIEKIMYRFLKTGSTDIRKFISEHRIVLLVDNLDFSNVNDHNLMRFQEFLEKNKNIRVVATSSQLYEGEIPFEIFEYRRFSSFKNTTIRSFKVREIRQLMKNWFKNNEEFGKPKKLDSILNILMALNLPRSPLSISMFLWIIEQQENYKPINHATMLENFIERLFKKQSRIEIYSDRFDFKNKERLLAEIAHFMYFNNLDNYEVSYGNLFSFVEQYLKNKRFDDFPAENILNHFFDKGIIIKEIVGAETFVRFRFTCFFQFFLTKKMEFDDQFREYVLKDENYLMFNNEIDYYTGLNRDKSTILETLIERMKKAYEELTEDIESFEYGFDTIFRTDKAFSKELDTKKFLEKLNKVRPNEEKLDKLRDDMLEEMKVEKGIKKKEEKIGTFKRMERIWTLSAKVLKNTEETNVDKLKDNAYKDIIKCSMAFAVFYKYSLDRWLKDKSDNIKIEIREQLELQQKILPLIHEIVLHFIMGTIKLSAVIRDKISSDFVSNEISEFERYLSVFLYADVKGKEYLEYIEKFVKTIKQSYIFDMTLFKLVAYYFLRSKSDESDQIYLNLISEIITRSKGLKKSDKGRIIEDYRNKKIKRIRDNKGDNTFI